MNNNERQTSGTRRYVLAVIGCVLTMASAYGLYVFAQLVGFVADDAGSGNNLWVDYGLVGASLALVGVAGLSLLWSALRGRHRDVVPGPTLYLLGLFLAALSLQAALISSAALAWLGVAAGGALIVFEYRSDFI
ncbi:MAG: hypothetical protein AAFO81_13620 [Pseudomonadota bacterium]